MYYIFICIFRGSVYIYICIERNITFHPFIMDIYFFLLFSKGKMATHNCHVEFVFSNFKPFSLMAFRADDTSFTELRSAQAEFDIHSNHRLLKDYVAKSREYENWSN